MGKTTVPTLEIFGTQLMIAVKGCAHLNSLVIKALVHVTLIMTALIQPFKRVRLEDASTLTFFL